MLYDSLVLSRLMYACSVWSDVPASLLKTLEAMIVGHHRRMRNDGFWNASTTTDDAFVKQHEIMPFRLHWARQRLVYLQHLVQHALQFIWSFFWQNL